MYSYCLNNWRPCLHDEVLLLDVLTDSSPSTWSSGKKKKSTATLMKYKIKAVLLLKGDCGDFVWVFSLFINVPLQALFTL